MFFSRSVQHLKLNLKFELCSCTCTCTPSRYDAMACFGKSIASPPLNQSDVFWVWFTRRPWMRTSSRIMDAHYCGVTCERKYPVSTGASVRGDGTASDTSSFTRENTHAAAHLSSVFLRHSKCKPQDVTASFFTLFTWQHLQHEIRTPCPNCQLVPSAQFVSFLQVPVFLLPTSPFLVVFIRGNNSPLFLYNWLRIG